MCPSVEDYSRDILRYLASGMNIDKIIEDFPDLTRQDILTSLEFAADQQKKIMFAARA